MNEKHLLNTIFQVVHEEDLELRRTANQGIFFAPELAIVYLIGKKIYQKRKYIFYTDNVKWIREQKTGTGICDLLFEVTDVNSQTKKVYIEFKLRDTVDAYARDIEKLRDKKCYEYNDIRLFCAVIDSFEHDRDGRIETLEKKYDWRRENKTDDNKEGDLFRINENFYDYSFETIQEWYKRQVYAIVGLWEVRSIGDESITLDETEEFIDMVENFEKNTDN